MYSVYYIDDNMHAITKAQKRRSLEESLDRTRAKFLYIQIGKSVKVRHVT